MKRVERFVVIICISALLFFLLQHIYLGLKTTHNEVDSLVYHLPIARHIKDNGWWSVPNLPMGLGYYPAVGETILAFILGNEERFINLFNVFGIVAVFIAAIFLGRSFKLNSDLSIVYATAVALLQPGMRLVNNQTVDIWFQFFTLLSLYLLSHKSRGKIILLCTGISLGLIAGTKYSGPLISLILLSFFYKKLKGIKLSNLLLFAVPYVAIGGFWYLRNYIQTGNPFYPGNISFFGFQFSGNPGHRLTDWMPLKTILFLPDGWWLFIEALISEYSVWIAFLVFFFVHLLHRKKSGLLQKKNGAIFKLILLGFILFSIFLITPSYMRNFISDLRYTLPGMSLLLLAFFIHFSKIRPAIPIFATVYSLILSFPLLSHHPKVNFISTILMISLLFVYKSWDRKLMTRASN